MIHDDDDDSFEYIVLPVSLYFVLSAVLSSSLHTLDSDLQSQIRGV